jgi:hypothetical protein
MKKLARRGLAFVLSFLMIVTTAYSDMSLIALADEVHHVWTKVELSQISPNDSIAIATSKDGVTYVLPNSKTSGAVVGVKADVNGDTLVITEGKDEDYSWTISEGGTVSNQTNNTEEDELLEVKELNLTDLVVEEDTKSEDDIKVDDEKKEETEEAEEANLMAESKVETEEADDSVEPEVSSVKSYTIKNGKMYLYSTKGNMAIGDSPRNENSKYWFADGDKLYVDLGTDGKKYLGLNKKAKWNTSYEFSISFYKLTDKVAGETPATLAAPTASFEDNAAVDFGAQVELTCATEDAKIYYNVNGNDDNYKLYDAPIEITRDTTIYAKSKLDDSESEVVSFHYTLAEGTKITDLTKVSEEQEFVLVNADTKAMAQTVNNGKIASYDVKLDDDKHLTVDDETAPIAKLKLVKAETENEYYITSDILEGDTVKTKYLSVEVKEKTCELMLVDEAGRNSIWSLEASENGAFLIKNVNAVFKDKAQYLEFYNGFTVYGFNDKKKDIYTFSAYTLPKVEKPVDVPTENTVAHLLTRELYPDDQVVVYYPAGKKVMTATDSGKGGLKDANATIAKDGTIDTKDTQAVVLTVKLDENGNYYFKTKDDKYLSIDLVETTNEKDGKTKTNANLVLSDKLVDNSYWTQVASDDKNEGNFYLKNVSAKVGSSVQSLEYYNAFKAWGHKDDPAYVFNFYALEEGEKPSTLEYGEDVLPVAKWGGNAQMDESQEYVNGDLYTVNDMLDKNAKFTAVISGDEVTPFHTTKGKTGSTNYYMGPKGMGSGTNDYLQFELSSFGYGNMTMDFRLRVSDAGAGKFQMQYSTDGENFKNFKNGKYSYKYTAYKGTEQYEVSGSGDITDGIALIKVGSQYITYSFDVPNGAANAEKLYIRLVPNDTRVKVSKSKEGEDLTTPGKTATLRIDCVEIKGQPVVGSDICGYVTADPVSGEISSNQTIALSSKTEGADIFYSVNGGEYTKYNSEEKVSLKKLPATISTYATKEGLTKSITVRHQYTQSQCARVKANPNGGAISENKLVTLTTKTEDAKIFYRYMSEEEIKAAESKTTATQETKPEKSEDKEGEEDEDDPQTEENVVDNHDDWIEYTEPFTVKNLPAQIQVKATKDGYKDSAVATLKFTKRLNDKYNIYFGQIHAHTSISDGAGTLDEALKHATNVDNLDYIVITDHSNSIDHQDISKITQNVDTADTDEWTYAHNLVKQYSTDKFTCAYGYEMTWSNGLGHMNTYNTPGFQSRTQKDYSTYATALKNYYDALKTVPDSISQFNHPGTTFGDFQDFSYYSEENDNLITMIEVGNGEGAIGSSGYFPSYEYYTRALDKGWHVAPTNNQDNHKGKWGDANTARTVMLADTNDENAIYDAMRNYRIYATEDNDLSIYYTLDGYDMGTILEKDAVGDTVELKAEIKDPTDSKIGKVQVIVNGGQVLDSKDVNTSEATVTFNVPSSYSYYYLKITEADKDIAVTAPVWVGEVEACGINKTYTNTILPVKGESLDVNVDFYNNEKTELQIDKIKIELNDGEVDKAQNAIYKPVVDIIGENAGVTSVASNGTATFKTDYTYNGAGKVTYVVTVNATLNGVPKTYTDKLSVNYTVPEMVGDVIIDGTHYNDYVTGYYGGNVNAFTKLCAGKNLRATVVTDKITAETLKGAKMLVIAAPGKYSGTAGAGKFNVSHFEDDFIEVVKDYIANGGTVVVCGLADFKDTTNCQTATEQNKLLEAIGSTIRMGSDEICDDTNNGGQVYRMYPKNFNTDADLLAGIKDGQMYSQYSGCSVDISNATATDFVDAAEWLVKGFDTTYSVDCKDGSGNAIGGELPNGVKGVKVDNEGNVTFLARQKTKAGGQIIVSGGVFVSDFEVKVEVDNNDTLPYANYTIANNLLDMNTVELKTSTIAEARKGNMNDVFTVEGYVTSGTDNENTTFFDTIYIQDETGGIDIFPYAESGLAIGTKMRITGFVAQYQGDIELKVLSAKILDDEPYVWAPKVVSTKDAMNYDELGGSLLKTTGKVTRVAFNDKGNRIEEFWLMDESGEEAAIFIDGYINSATTGKNQLAQYVKVGKEISATGILYKHPEGASDVSVPVFRVRNCDEITYADGTIPELADPEPAPQPSQPSFVERVVSGIVNTVRNIVNAIHESPVAQAIRNLFGFGNNNATGRNTRRAAAVVAEPAPEETVEETPAVEEPETVTEAQTEQVIADEDTPLAAENTSSEKSFPVVPVAAASVIILVGAGLFIKKKGLLGK